MHRLGLIFGLFLAASLALAQGGALPKGDLGTVDQGKVKAPSAPKGEARRNCLLDSLRPTGGSGVWSATGDAFYLLASRGPTAKMQKKGAESLKTKYTLYKLTMKGRKVEALLSLDHKGDATLVAFGSGEELTGISAVSFIGKSMGCNEGPAGMVSISMQGGKAVQGTGQFALAAGPMGRTLIDAKKLNVLEMDTSNFQTRSVRALKDFERPLWFDGGARRLVTFRDDGKVRGLVDYKSEDDKKARKLAFKPEERALQQKDLFGMARLDAAKNAIEIQELPEWSGQKEPQSFRVVLPGAFAVATAGVDIHFEKRLALVSGGTFVARQQWQKLFVFAYQRQDPLFVISAPGKQYVSFAAFDPTGAYAAVEARDIESRATTSFKIFDVAKKKIEEIKLPAPK